MTADSPWLLLTSGAAAAVAALALLARPGWYAALAGRADPPRRERAAVAAALLLAAAGACLLALGAPTGAAAPRAYWFSWLRVVLPPAGALALLAALCWIVVRRLRNETRR